MPALMADNDVQRAFDAMLDYLTSPEWQEHWLDIQMTVTDFEHLGLSRQSPDAQVWQMCQARQIVLVTGNRNDEGPDSLEATLRVFNDMNCLPVITLARPRRMLESKDYLRRCAVKMLEYLMELDRYRGTGRLFVP